MMDDEGKYFSYTNRMYLKETKRLKYQTLLKNYKDKIGITKIEEGLNKYNSKTCNIEKFQEYINAKIKANETLVPLYQEQKFRQYKWYGYINKKRTEDNMVNKIVKKYSKDHIIIIGDWSIGKQMRNFISTPNLTLKRKLLEIPGAFLTLKQLNYCLKIIKQAAGITQLLNPARIFPKPLFQLGQAGRNYSPSI